jgi:hypothetical protein
MANVACPACGTLNRSGANFCKQCRTALNTQMPVSVYQPAPSQVATRFLDDCQTCSNALRELEHNIRARWLRRSDYNQMRQMLLDLAELGDKIVLSIVLAYKDFQESDEGVRLQESAEQKLFDFAVAILNAPMLLTPPNLPSPSVSNIFQGTAGQNSARRREIANLLGQYNKKIREIHSWRRSSVWRSIFGFPDPRELPDELDFKGISLF